MLPKNKLVLIQKIFKFITFINLKIKFANEMKPTYNKG